ncbi:MAG TPA: TadE family protein [Nonomuraea sp.]|nr:TadE family protein [Nonomuraea sp.]
MSRPSRVLRRFRRDRRGATAIEFAMILPIFCMLVLGIVNGAQLANTVSSMNYAVQEAARCSAVNKTVCDSASATRAYAVTKYLGPAVGPVFVSSTAGCGHTVTATATFELNVAVMVYDVPLSAASCYPGRD